MTSRIRNLLPVVGALVLVGGATWAFISLWSQIGGGPMTGHGWVALALGLIGTIILAIVLMVLAFRSDSSGWDVRAENELENGRKKDDDGL